MRHAIKALLVLVAISVTPSVVFAAGIPSEIANFLSRVRAQCGSVHVISTFRRGARIAGTHRKSCHATGQAVDYTTSNPSCALRVAAGSSLGHSIDYGRARHFHVSTCAQERGARFAHGGSTRRTRYARNRHHRSRYASRGQRSRYAAVSYGRRR